MSSGKYRPEDLRAFAIDVLVAHGVSDTDAETCAKRLVDGDMRGQPAHGIARLPAYARRIAEGGMNPRAIPNVLRQTSTSALVDGDNGLGPVVMTFACQTAINKARSDGLAWVGVRNSNHAGAGGVWAQLVVDSGLIGIFAAVANVNQMAPWGGIDLLLGPNPIAIGIPGGKSQGILLDIATSTVSMGTVRQRVAAGETLPVGWLIDEAGQPVTDPQLAGGASLVPVGGYKGFGLSLAIAAIAGTLNGAPTGSHIIDNFKDWTSPSNTGQMIFALNPELFGERADFADEMDARLAEIRDSTPMSGYSQVCVPGDRAAAQRARAERDGIEVATPVLSELRELAVRLELPNRLK